MNELQIFKSPEFGQVRMIVEDEKILFCASDVASALGYSNISKAINDHCPHVTKRYIGVETGRKADGTPAIQNIKMNFIPEGDVYRLVIRSKIPSAVKFEGWVFDDILPSMRKNGGYIVNKPLNQLDILEKSIQIMKEQQKRLEEHDNRLAKVENNIQQIKELEQINASNWRLYFGSVTRKIAKYYPCLDMENPYQAIRHEFYERLENEAHCNLNIRLKNKKERAYKAGFNKNKIKEINKLDIIGEDARLINSAIAVLKKMSIQYGIN